MASAKAERSPLVTAWTLAEGLYWRTAARLRTAYSNPRAPVLNDAGARGAYGRWGRGWDTLWARNAPLDRYMTCYQIQQKKKRLVTSSHAYAAEAMLAIDAKLIN